MIRCYSTTLFGSFLVLLFQTCALSALATSIPGYPDEGHWGRGPTTTIEYWASGPESIVLYGDGSLLVIADVSTPSAMAVLGQVNTSYVVESIDIRDDGQVAAVVDDEKWVTLVDISNRAAPAILGRYEVEDGRKPTGSAFGTGFLYVSVGPAGLWALNISDLAHPTLEGTYIEPGTDFVFDVEVSGDYAFLADDVEGVTAIDISDPSNPTFADRFLGAAKASHISIDGTRAYVSRRNQGFHILDLSAAPTMTDLGSFYAGGITYRTEALGTDRIVSADGINGLQVFDISNPALPILESTFTRSMFTVTTDGSAAFSTRVSDIVDPTLYALDVDTTAPFDPPAHVGSLPLVGNNVGVTVDQDFVLIANQTGGAFILDGSDPTDPQIFSEIDLGTQGIKALAKVGSTLAYGSFGNDLGLVDLSDPALPVLLPDYEMPGAGYAGDVMKLPGIPGVVIGAGPEGVLLLNLSNPLAPVEIGDWTPSSGAVLHVDFNGSRIAAAGNTDVWVLDASTLSTPIEETSFTVPGVIRDVAIDGDTVYVATNDLNASVRIFDISNPLSPTEISVFDTAPTFANGVSVYDDRLYLATDRFWGLIIVDVTDPSNPMNPIVIDTPGTAEKVSAGPNLVALADGAGGVRIWGTAPELVLFGDGFESGDLDGWQDSAP